ncbi:hypothetical protein PYV50_15310 [Pseudomonas sp. H22_DOA]|nr:hypothetical protein PYV50_15310 [Pseudomonas sp. H22_DOA]
MLDNKIISKDVAADVAGHVFKIVCGINFLGSSAEFVAQLCIIRSELGYVLSPSDQSLLKAIEFVSKETCKQSFLASAQVLLWALCNDSVDRKAIETFLEGTFENDPGHDELLVLGKIVACFDGSENESISEAYDEAVANHLISSVEDDFPESILSNCTSQSDARSKLKNSMDERASELGATDSSSVANTVIDAVDVDEHYDKYFYDSEYERDYDSYRDQKIDWSGALSVAVDPIDDLFARD